MPFARIDPNMSDIAQYFKENPGVTKLKRGAVYTLQNGTPINLSKSILRATTSTGQQVIYEFGETLGAGAYGLVKKAYDLISGKEFAIKIQHADTLDPKQQGKFVKNLRIEEDFMADPRVDLLIARQDRIGSARSNHASHFAKGAQIQKFYSVQKLLKGKDLDRILDSILESVESDIKTIETPAHQDEKTDEGKGTYQSADSNSLTSNEEFFTVIYKNKQEKAPDFSVEEAPIDDAFNTFVYKTASEEYAGTFVHKSDSEDEEAGTFVHKTGSDAAGTFVHKTGTEDGAGTFVPKKEVKKPVIPNFTQSFAAIRAAALEIKKFDLNTEVKVDNVLSLLRIVKNMALKLATIHAAQILHLDIKPANIKLDPETLEVVIFDFGVSQRLAPLQDIIQSKNPVGTPYYMAPEVRGLSGSAILSAKADVFSLGKTFKEVIETTFMKGKKLELRFSFNNPTESLSIHVLNELAATVRSMLANDDTQRANMVTVLQDIARMEKILISHQTRNTLDVLNADTITEALKLYILNNGAAITVSEAIRFVRESSGQDTKLLRRLIQDLVPKVNLFAQQPISKQLNSIEAPTLQDTHVSEDDPLLVMQKTKDFTKALEVLKRKTPNLSRSAAMAFARDCERQKLCNRVTARNAILQAGI